MMNSIAIHEVSTWHIEHTTEVPARPATIWAFFRDVAGWKTWNPGVTSSELEGPFETGAWFTMTPTGGELLRSQLLEVRENECFVDVTRVGDLVVTVEHRLTALTEGLTRVSYALSAKGPGAAEIGPLIAADFPDVLASLKAHAGEVRS
jgi:carbon monoxide dehydrogenase subunit G